MQSRGAFAAHPAWCKDLEQRCEARAEHREEGCVAGIPPPAGVVLRVRKVLQAVHREHALDIERSERLVVRTHCLHTDRVVGVLDGRIGSRGVERAEGIYAPHRLDAGASRRERVGVGAWHIVRVEQVGRYDVHRARKWQG
eukprot:scaffold14937_cov57-Phaeocystis_antarctica.AAC.6